MVQIPAEQKSSGGTTVLQENAVQDINSINKVAADKLYIESVGSFENDSYLDCVFREKWIEEKENLPSNGQYIFSINFYCRNCIHCNNTSSKLSENFTCIN